ncbi:MAG: helix-turn-helix domain-containing protein [Alphaproteobacteria bacterium]|jgi:transcriptional regulator with XRE-family HTH domain|nr:helix-turn-helix domain-containing protein [Alphaproteobacteria bacterium]
MSDSKHPSDIDRIVGQRVRWRRRELKLTQEKLGDLLDLTFQQVQKYEKGVNRISAGRLYEVASVLGVPVTYFYDGAEESLATERAGFAEMDEDVQAPVMNSETLDLVAAFQNIADPALRKSILATVKAASKALRSPETT